MSRDNCAINLLIWSDMINLVNFGQWEKGVLFYFSLCLIYSWVWNMQRAYDESAREFGYVSITQSRSLQTATQSRSVLKRGQVIRQTLTHVHLCLDQVTGQSILGEGCLGCTLSSPTFGRLHVQICTKKSQWISSNWFSTDRFIRVQFPCFSRNDWTRFHW